MLQPPYAAITILLLRIIILRKQENKMEPINVLVLTPAFERTSPRANEAVLEQIRHSGPGISVKDGSEVLAAELRGEPGANEKLKPLLAEADVIFGLLLP